ncbi:hypothetical protein AA313_de0208570 [Arthrobotrys entomopaga]|nr:hypothetical protein AA313_de0208570 [Arthrobotrys entomopaga]
MSAFLRKGQKHPYNGVPRGINSPDHIALLQRDSWNTISDWLTNLVGTVEPSPGEFIFEQAPLWLEQMREIAPLEVHWKTLKKELNIKDPYDPATPEHSKLAKSFFYYTHFRKSLEDLCKKAHDLKENKREYAISYWFCASQMAMSLREIQDATSEYLQQCPSLIYYIYCLTCSAGMVFAGFDLKEWAHGVTARFPSDNAVANFHRNVQRSAGIDESQKRVTPPAEYGRRFMDDLTNFHGRYPDNRPWKKPNFIFEDGKQIVNRRLSYLTYEVESEQSIFEDYMDAIARQQKNPDRDIKVPDANSKEKPEDPAITNQRHRDVFMFEQAFRLRRKYKLSSKKSRIYQPALEEDDFEGYDGWGLYEEEEGEGDWRRPSESSEGIHTDINACNLPSPPSSFGNHMPSSLSSFEIQTSPPNEDYNTNSEPSTSLQEQQQQQQECPFENFIDFSECSDFIYTDASGEPAS